MYAERIKQIRSELQMSVAKLSKRINIPERTIVSYESDGRTPSLEFLAQLCKELSVNPHWFLFGDGEVFTKHNLTSSCVCDGFEQLVLQVLKKHGITK